MVKITKNMTVEEVVHQLEADPEYARRKAERERKFQEREAQSRVVQKALLEDLAKAGVNIATVWDLVNTSSPYPSALPILLEHLQKPYPDEEREGIARALAVRATRSIGWQILVDEFCKTDVSNKRVKDALAVALGEASDDSVLTELISIARDKRHGESRVLLLSGIRRSKRPEAKKAIAELAKDPQLAKEIKSWRKSRE
jgi:hypothetical protein